MRNDDRFRHELKYLINKADMDCCMERIGTFSERDPHAKNGSYLVRSLYFDDRYESAYEDKESGVGSRSKYRIRLYDMDRSFISLEQKIKESAYIQKRSATISETEYDKISNGDTAFLLKRDERCANDFAVKWRTDRLRPKVIIDYDRIPFVCADGDVRITFDMDIRAVNSHDLFDVNAPSYRVMDGQLLIMEVKYTDYLPDVFRAILPDNTCRLAASKYVMSIDTLRRIQVI